MNSEWKEVRLGDLISLRGGLAYKGEHISESGTPMVTMGCVDPGSRFKREGLKYYRGSFGASHTAKTGDIVIATRDVTQKRETIGCPCLIPDDLGSEEAVVATNTYLVTNISNIDNSFLYLLLKSPSYREQIVASAKGSTVVMITKDAIENYSTLLPPPVEQKAIAHILGTLDDKIELNRKTNETLEAMATALFKSWFVDFDPVRAKAEGRPTGLQAEISDLFPDSFQDSELGVIPSGWKVGCLSDCCEITMGQSPPGDTYNEDGVGLPFYQGKTDFGFRFPRRRIYCSAPTRQASIGATLISVRAPVGSANIAKEVCSIGRGIAALKSRQSADSFVYYLIGTLQVVFESYNSEGTVFGAINGKDLASIQIVVPSTSAIAAFNSQCFPMDESIKSNTQETEHLINIRDALLPKLISGEIRIPDAEKMLEEVGV